MSKIPNWSPVDAPNPTRWNHDHLNLSLEIEKNWLIEGEEYNGYRVVRSDNDKRVAYGDTKQEARENAVDWMRDNPMQSGSKYSHGDRIDFPDGDSIIVDDMYEDEDGVTQYRVRELNSLGEQTGTNTVDAEDLDGVIENHDGELTKY